MTAIGADATADLATVAELTAPLRVDLIHCSTSAGSGRPTSSMSAADLLGVLIARHLRYSWDNPERVDNNHLIFSKGRPSPLAYSVFEAVGVVSDEGLLTGYRRFGHRLQGHPTPALPWVDVATGSTRRECGCDAPRARRAGSSDTDVSGPTRPHGPASPFGG